MASSDQEGRQTPPKRAKTTIDEMKTQDEARPDSAQGLDAGIDDGPAPVPIDVPLRPAMDHEEERNKKLDEESGGVRTASPDPDMVNAQSQPQFGHELSLNMLQQITIVGQPMMKLTGEKEKQERKDDFESLPLEERMQLWSAFRDPAQGHFIAEAFRIYWTKKILRTMQSFPFAPSKMADAGSQSDKDKHSTDKGKQRVQEADDNILPPIAEAAETNDDDKPEGSKTRQLAERPMFVFGKRKHEIDDRVRALLEDMDVSNQLLIVNHGLQIFRTQKAGEDPATRTSPPKHEINSQVQQEVKKAAEDPATGTSPPKDEIDSQVQQEVKKTPEDPATGTSPPKYEIDSRVKQEVELWPPDVQRKMFRALTTMMEMDGKLLGKLQQGHDLPLEIQEADADAFRQGFGKILPPIHRQTPGLSDEHRQKLAAIFDENIYDTWDWGDQKAFSGCWVTAMRVMWESLENLDNGAINQKRHNLTIYASLVKLFQVIAGAMLETGEAAFCAASEEERWTAYELWCREVKGVFDLLGKTSQRKTTQAKSGKGKSRMKKVNTNQKKVSDVQKANPGKDKSHVKKGTTEAELEQFRQKWKEEVSAKTKKPTGSSAGPSGTNINLEKASDAQMVESSKVKSRVKKGTGNNRKKTSDARKPENDKPDDPAFNDADKDIHDSLLRWNKLWPIIRKREHERLCRIARKFEEKEAKKPVTRERRDFLAAIVHVRPDPRRPDGIPLDTAIFFSSYLMNRARNWFQDDLAAVYREPRRPPSQEEWEDFMVRRNFWFPEPWMDGYQPHRKACQCRKCERTRRREARKRRKEALAKNRKALEGQFPPGGGQEVQSETGTGSPCEVQ